MEASSGSVTSLLGSLRGALEVPLGGNAMIHESDIVCGGDWMCLTEAELEGFDVENIAG